MFNWFKKILGLHVHEFSNWYTGKVMRSDYGSVIILQHRVCEKCGFIETHRTLT